MASKRRSANPPQTTPSPSTTTQGRSTTLPQPPPPKPWYAHITLDLLAHILSRSVFHPAIVYIFYLCLAAVHRHRTPLATATLYWAGILLSVSGLRWLNHRLAQDGSSGSRRRRRPRTSTSDDEDEDDNDDDVVVITGGGSGLGRILASLYAFRGTSVCVLDIYPPASTDEAEELALLDGGSGGGSGHGSTSNLHWYLCDVSNPDAVAATFANIRRELGPPTVLINNAAGAISGTPLTRLGVEAARSTVAVDLLGHFNTMAPFLGVGREGWEGWEARSEEELKSAKEKEKKKEREAERDLTVVTISSILAHLAPARLAAYAASKAAVSSLHHTLTAEARRDPHLRGRVTTLLVEVGQMDTPLFARVATPWYARFLGPVLEAKDVAKRIVERVDRGEGGVLRMPLYALVVPWYVVLPGSLQRLVRWVGGIDWAVGEGVGEGEVGSK